MAHRSMRMIVSSSATSTRNGIASPPCPVHQKSPQELVLLKASLPSATASARSTSLGYHPGRTDPAHGLRDALLVLDEREANEPLTVHAEAATWADGNVCVAQEAKRELLRRLGG